MKIPLSRGLFAIVDDDCPRSIADQTWSALRRYNKWYAGRHVGKSYLYLHQAVLDGAPRGAQIDHRDGNGLNNTRKNLRVVTRSQNATNPTNSSRKKNLRSGYRGVWPNTDGWVAVIQHMGKRRYLGQFATPELAAAAYNTAALSLRGGNTSLNRVSFDGTNIPRQRRTNWTTKAKLSSLQVQEIRARCAAGNVTYASLAIEFGVSPVTISQVARRLIWRDVP